MLKLCRETFELLRRHPALWLPYVLAELVAQLLWWVRGVGERAIFNWFAVTRTTSVLGGAYVGLNPSYEARIHALQAYAPVGLAAVYLCVASYVLAFVLTGKTLELIREERPLRWFDLLASSGRHWRSIFVFSLIFPLAMALLTGACVGPVILLLRGAEHAEQLKLCTFAAFTCAFSATVWLLLPRAIKVLRPDARAAVSVTLRWQGAAFAVAAMLMELALGVLLQQAEAGIVLDSHAEICTLAVLNGLVSNLPAMFLFVFLALLVEDCSASGLERAEMVRSEESEA
jgi:hypothetical protein